MSSINGISNEDSTKLATMMMGLSLGKEALKKYVGSDGMEFEIIYQSLLDYMMQRTDDSNLKNLLGATGSSNKGTISADELKNMLNNGTSYAAATNKVSNTTQTTPVSNSYTSNDTINSVVQKYANKYGVNSNLILSVIKAESDFNPRCTSGAGAQGLMQLMPENSRYYGVTDPYDIDQNINAGTQLLKQYLDMYGGNTEMALAAYNAGPGTLQQRGVSSTRDFYKLPSETRHYVPKVMGYYNNGL